MLRRRMTSSRRLNWPFLFMEVLAIVSSVLLALALDDWRERRKINDRVEKAIETIQYELTQNQKEVAKALEYHEPLVHNLSSGDHLMTSIDLSKIPFNFNSEQTVAQSLRRYFASRNANLFDDIDVVQSGEGMYYAKVGSKEVRLHSQNDSLKIYGVGGIQLRPARILNYAWDTALATQVTLNMDPELVASLTQLSQLNTTHNETVGRIINMLYGQGGSVVPAMQDLLYFEKLLLERYESVQALLDEQ